MGYKRRNARLDSLSENPPRYLARSKDSLGKETFAGTDDEDELNDVYAQLHEQFNLLNNVIEARRLHHSLFFSVDMDYGHQAYIDKLSNRKYLIERAPERLTRRIAQVLYDRQQWFPWTRELQEDEDKHRQSEKAKMQHESAMFKRHAKELEARLAQKRRRENNRKQELFLDEAYRARLAEEDVETWDPIQDERSSLRADYVDLIRHFLWLPAQEIPLPAEPEGVRDTTKNVANEELPSTGAAETGKKKKKKRPQPKPKANGESTSSQTQPDKQNIETVDQLRDRLGRGMHISDMPRGAYLVGTVENPTEELWNTTAPMAASEVDGLVDQMKEIK